MQHLAGFRSHPGILPRPLRISGARPGPIGYHWGMPELEIPCVHVRESFVAAMDEFRAEGRGDPLDATMVGHEIRTFAGRWREPDGFAAYVHWLVGQAREDAPRPDGFVPSTTLWWVDASGYLGRVAVRHRLNASLFEVGGHIGYDVRPSARRRGHATAMLRAALPVARELGIESGWSPATWTMWRRAR